MILGVVEAGMIIIRKWDKPLPLTSRGYFGILVSAIVMKAAISYITMGEPGGNRWLLSIIGGCLVLACVTDLALCQVYNFIWWIALTAAAVLLWRRLCLSGMQTKEEMLIALLLFFTLQYTVFCRTYGKADGYAFCVCAVTEAARGMKLAGYLSHMLLAYTLLLLVQTIGGNLNRRGNLKKSVPFLPYITMAFWMVILLKGKVQSF